MAETAQAGKGLGATLGKKVGPLPLGAWLVIGGGLYWYMSRKQAAAAGQQAGQGQAPAGYGTDPAGNYGLIDPNTGYVQGSAEDVAALQAQASQTGASFNTASGTSGSTGGDGGVATTPSGTATATPGAPAGPTVPAPGGPLAPKKGWHYPAPSGLGISNVSDTGFQVSWNPVTGPQGQKPSTYTVQTWQQNGVKVDQQVTGATTAKVYGAGGKGLHPGWSYRTDVWANGGPEAPPHASAAVTLKPKGQK